MEHYQEIIIDTLETLQEDGRDREEILKAWADGDTGDDFGNMTGSRTCNAWQAQEDLKAAGFPWDDEINEMLDEYDYKVGELLNRGPEVVDVIICELLAPRMAGAMLEGE